MTVDDEVCLITQPISAASSGHIESLVDIIGSITQVSLIAANLPEEHTLRDDIEVVDIASVGTGNSILTSAIRFVRNQFRMGRAIQQRPENIIWFFGATSYLLPIFVAKLTGKQVVIHPRGDVPLSLRLKWEDGIASVVARFLAGIVRVLERIGFRLADQIVVYSPSMVDQLNLGRYGDKVNPNGARYIDTEQFAVTVPYEERESVVGYVGRFDAEKRLSFLADVARQLPNNVQMRFVGDGPYRDELEHDLADEIADEKVTLTGWVDQEELPTHYNEFKLLLVTSHATEGLPTVILEAFACGTPVCATPVASVPDVVREDETGWHIVTDDPDMLATQITDILESPKAEQVSSTARDTATSRYGFTGAVERYRGILKEVSG